MQVPTAHRRGWLLWWWWLRRVGRAPARESFVGSNDGGGRKRATPFPEKRFVAWVVVDLVRAGENKANVVVDWVPVVASATVSLGVWVFCCCCPVDRGEPPVEVPGELGGWVSKIQLGRTGARATWWWWTGREGKMHRSRTTRSGKRGKDGVVGAGVLKREDNRRGFLCPAPSPLQVLSHWDPMGY